MKYDQSQKTKKGEYDEEFERENNRFIDRLTKLVRDENVFTELQVLTELSTVIIAVSHTFLLPSFP